MNRTKQKSGTVFRTVSFILTIVFVMSFTSCKSRDPVTAEAFKETVEALGYEVSDLSEQYSEQTHILKILSCEGDSVYMEFLEIDSNDNAAATYNNDKELTEEYKSSGSSESSVSSGNYQKYTLKTEEKIYLVERVGTTLICASCDKAESDKLDEIIEKLGY